MRKIIPYNPRLIPLAKKLRMDMTLSEVLLWQELKNKQLGVRFSRQIPIDEFIVDFYCKDLMLAIEIDGNSHNNEDKPEKDRSRQKRLESLGILFLRFHDIDVKTKIKWVLNEIDHWIKTHPLPLQGGE
ncbi:endonuclease domain-containing protein [Ekhidna sp.]|uniref:endonuclease domain-containing protein n=1 Tax=Ekhidna sp. TaxID=2608089 RepID=UPI003B50FBA8